MKNGHKTWAWVKDRIKGLLEDDCRLCNEDYWEMKNLFDELREAVNAEDGTAAERLEALKSVLNFLGNADHLNGAQQEGLVYLAGEIAGVEYEEARLLTLEQARTAVGHGWEEVWFEEDEEMEMEERKMLFESVFINGHIQSADGDISEVEPETYNKPYHSRLWMGDTPPTEEQRTAAAWDDTGD